MSNKDKQHPLAFVAELVPDEMLNLRLDKAVNALREYATKASRTDTQYNERFLVEYTPDGKTLDHAGVEPSYPRNLPREIKRRALYEIGRSFIDDAGGVVVLVTHVADAWLTRLEDANHVSFSPGDNEENRMDDAFVVTSAALDGRMAYCIMPYEWTSDGTLHIIEDDVVLEYHVAGMPNAAQEDVANVGDVNEFDVAVFYSGVIAGIRGENE
jgi:hypothetical protein